ncbi:MAG: hypothetical protein KKD73_10545 [Proteobacteria bacterium]|nr:hypothetical protein [Pseudomonadota bacterium]MBU1640424.1 hypothetical protein [Pseudomonadota bacterium]
MEKVCLNCKFFKVDDLQAGVCRKVKGEGAPRPLKRHGDTCDGWQDAGQQYSIRMGWIMAQQKKDGPVKN